MGTTLTVSLTGPPPPARRAAGRGKQRRGHPPPQHPPHPPQQPPHQSKIPRTVAHYEEQGIHFVNKAPGPVVTDVAQGVAPVVDGGNTTETVAMAE